MAKRSSSKPKSLAAQVNELADQVGVPPDDEALEVGAPRGPGQPMEAPEAGAGAAAPIKPEGAELLEALRRHFPEEMVERTFTADRKVNGKVVRGTGKGYDTTGIKYQAIADRLNDVFGIFGWTATDELQREEQVPWGKGGQAWVVVTKVTIRVDVDLQGRRVSTQRSCYGYHKSRDWGDAAKGAFTNALKKTAALLGCGAEAYLGQLDDDNYHDPAEGNGQAPTGQQEKRQEPREQPPAEKVELTEVERFNQAKADVAALGGFLGKEVAKGVCGHLPADRSKWRLVELEAARNALRMSVLAREAELAALLEWTPGQRADWWQAALSVKDPREARPVMLVKAMEALEDHANAF